MKSFEFNEDVYKKRFWEKVITIPFHECWEWIGNVGGDGYGRMRHDGKLISAHRLSWKLHFGDIPKDLFVCHKCDNTTCIRPDHLFLGTAKDNMIDMVKKKRHISFNKFKSGSNHINSKLKEQNILEIRTSPLSNKRLAKRFNVASRTICKIRAYTAWRHV